MCSKYRDTVIYLQTKRHLKLRLHMLKHHRVVATQTLLQLHGAPGLLLLPRAPKVRHDALELLRQRQLCFLLDLKALLGTLTLNSRRAL